MTDKQIGAKIAKIRALRTKIETLEKQKKLMEDEIKALCGEPSAQPRMLGGYKVVYTTFSRVSIDSRGLQQFLPDVYAQFSRVTTYNQLRIS